MSHLLYWEDKLVGNLVAVELLTRCCCAVAMNYGLNGLSGLSGLNGLSGLSGPRGRRLYKEEKRREKDRLDGESM